MRTGTPLPPCIDEQAILALVGDELRPAFQLVLNMFNTFLPAITELQNIVNGRLGKGNLALDNWLQGDPWVKVELNQQNPQQAMRVRHARPHDGLDTVGGVGKYVQSIEIDGRGHIASWAEADNAAADKAHEGDAWVVVNDAGASTVEFSHANKQTTAGTIDASSAGFEFNAITVLQFDAKGHGGKAGSATAGFDANEHLSFVGTNLNHDDVGATASTIDATGASSQEFGAITIIALDNKGHVVKADSSSAKLTAGNHISFANNFMNHDAVGSVDQGIALTVFDGDQITLELDQWGHVVSFTKAV